MNPTSRGYVFILLALSALSSRSEEIYVTIEDARPILKFMRTLSPRLCHAFTYEDPQYMYAGDLKDATAIVRPNGPTQPKIFWPRESKLEVRRISMPQDKSMQSFATMVDKVLALQSTYSIGGQFKLLKI